MPVSPQAVLYFLQFYQLAMELHLTVHPSNKDKSLSVVFPDMV